MNINRAYSLRLLHWAPVTAVLLIGGWYTMHNIRQSAQVTRRLKQRQQDIQALQHMAHILRQDQQCMAQYETLSKQQLVPLREILMAAAPGTPADIHARSPEPLAQGWIAQRADVIFDDVPLQAVARFIQEAERGRPPWRMRECYITASEQQRGNGRVTLVMEGLEKQRPDQVD
jgi:hypothetical protein